MIKTVASLAVAAALGVSSYYAVDHYAPAWTAELRGLVSATGFTWSEAAVKQDPVGYLEHTREQLSGQKDDLQRIIKDIRKNMSPLEGHIQERTQELAKTEAFLKEGRGIYQEAKQVEPQESVQAIKFAGRMYPDLETFKAQLELLFHEKEGNEALLRRARETKKRLDERLYSMLLQQGKLEMAIQEIGPQIAIVQAQVTTEQLDAIMQRTHRVTEGVLDTTQKMVQDFGPVGTTKDLLETSKGVYTANPSANQAFAMFLEG